MARPPRLEFPGARHHVMNRGARHGEVLFSPVARKVFLSRAQALPERFGVRVHAFALMPNHYHLLVTSDDGRLSEAMQYLGCTFTQWVNSVPRWDGPVFRGRFHNVLVQDESHWDHLLAYLHLNPVRSGRVAHPDQSDWTSHRAYLLADRWPTWLDLDEHLERLGGPAGVASFVEQVRTGDLEAPAHFDRATSWKGQKVRRQRGPREILPAQVSIERARSLLGVRDALGPDHPMVGAVGWLAMELGGAPLSSVSRRLGTPRSTLRRRVEDARDSALAHQVDGLLAQVRAR